MSNAANLSNQEAGREVATVEEYGDEVMCAGWNPQLDQVGDLIVTATGKHAKFSSELASMDIDDFLKKMYTYQC